MVSGCLPVPSLHCSLSCAHSGWVTAVLEGERAGLARQAFPPSHARTYAGCGEAFWPLGSPKSGQGAPVLTPLPGHQVQVCHMRQYSYDTRVQHMVPGIPELTVPGPQVAWLQHGIRVSSSSPALTTSWQHPGLPQGPPATWFSNSPSSNSYVTLMRHVGSCPPFTNAESMA